MNRYHRHRQEATVARWDAQLDRVATFQQDNWEWWPTRLRHLRHARELLLRPGRGAVPGLCPFQKGDRR